MVRLLDAGGLRGAPRPGRHPGAGSIRDAHAADRFIAAGARFIVGPSFNAEVARLCNGRRIPYLPGCATPTEIVTAEESGVELVKVFPGDSLGPAFVRAIRGPLPETQVVVTGGVAATEASVNEWIGAGAACLGFGSALVSRAHTAADGAADPAGPHTGGRPPHRPRRGCACRRPIPRSRQGVPLVTQAIAARDYQNLIDGRWVDAADGRTSERMSPAHDVVVGRYPAGWCRGSRSGRRGRPQGFR